MDFPLNRFIEIVEENYNIESKSMDNRLIIKFLGLMILQKIVKGFILKSFKNLILKRFSIVLKEVVKGQKQNIEKYAKVYVKGSMLSMINNLEMNEKMKEKLLENLK